MTDPQTLEGPISLETRLQILSSEMSFNFQRALNATSPSDRLEFFERARKAGKEFLPYQGSQAVFLYHYGSLLREIAVGQTPMDEVGIETTLYESKAMLVKSISKIRQCIDQRMMGRIRKGIATDEEETLFTTHEEAMYSLILVRLNLFDLYASYGLRRDAETNLQIAYQSLCQCLDTTPRLVDKGVVKRMEKLRGNLRRAGGMLYLYTHVITMVDHSNSLRSDDSQLRLNHHRNPYKITASPTA